MRALPGTAGFILAAICLTACEDSTAPGGGDGAKVAPAIAVAPARLIFRIYAFAPERDTPVQVLIVTNGGGGNLAWDASASAGWLTLGRSAVGAAGRLQVGVSRADMHLGVGGHRPMSLTGKITFSAEGASNSPVQIPVSVLISYQRRSKIAPGGDPHPDPR